MSTARGFDRLARYYSLLEYIVFADLLLRARFALLSELKDLQQVLIIGEGNGRLLKKILSLFPNVQLDVVEQSPRMIEIAKSRLTNYELRQVNFVEEDILEFTPKSTYDCIFSPFFLDCFEEAELNIIIAKLSSSLKDNGYWYDVDFYLPRGGFALARAKLYLTILYKFFRLASNLKTQNLANTEAIFIANNYQLIKAKTLSMQLLKTSLYKKSSP